MSFKIKIDVYEGPMDLLLYLVKREELDVKDIPIARIANEYLEYVNIMRLLDLEFAAEFVLMAAILMRIKVQSLLPGPPPEEEEEDPRLELQRRLHEYQKFKEAAVKLGHREETARVHFPRSCSPFEEPEAEDEIEASLFDLLAAFKSVLSRKKDIEVYEVEAPRRSVEERMTEILDALAGRKGVRFISLFGEQSSRSDLVVTFLAILELIRLQRIRVSQRKEFGAITLRLAKTPQELNEPH
jgi:segregation and condensation protein A